MDGGGLDKHQLAGLDNLERGFSRPVEFERVGEGYRAILRYETVRVTTEEHPTQDDALTILIQTLHAQIHVSPRRLFPVEIAIWAAGLTFSTTASRFRLSGPPESGKPAFPIACALG